MLYAFVVAVFLFSLQGIKLPTLQIGSYAGKLVRSVRCLSAHFDTIRWTLTWGQWQVNAQLLLKYVSGHSGEEGGLEDIVMFKQQIVVFVF